MRYEVELSYTFWVEASNWYEANEVAEQAATPASIRHPQGDTQVELEIDVGEGFNG